MPKELLSQIVMRCMNLKKPGTWIQIIPNLNLFTENKNSRTLYFTRKLYEQEKIIFHMKSNSQNLNWSNI